MARRSSKKKKENDFIDLVMKGSFLFTFAIAYLFTSSIIHSLILGCIGFIAGMIFLVLRKKQFNDKLKASGIHEIDNMTGRTFELYLRVLFEQMGYKVEVTQESGDYGADLLLVKNNQKIVVQAKRWKNNVGIEAIQQAHSAKDYYKANESWVVTNSYFTEQAINLANANNVKLIDRDKLVNLIINLKQNVKADVNFIENVSFQTMEQEHKEINIICKCGGTMVIKSGTRGDFLGCTNFPKCRNTLSIK
jgi:restriction system protein